MRVASSWDMRVSPVLPAGKVWVRLDCFKYRDRGPYHWTRECIEGRALIEISRAEAAEMPNLRPCKLCAARDRRRNPDARRVTSCRDL
jgi:hypothetical protein